MKSRGGLGTPGLGILQGRASSPAKQAAGLEFALAARKGSGV